MNVSRLAAFGSAIGDPGRAQIVAALASGTRHTAGELARRIALAPSTTSRHLAVLVDAGLIDVQPSGRHRYFGLASADVADMLEAIDALELTETNPPQRPRPDEPLRLARSCYDHLAGRLGVELAAAMIDNEFLTADELSITDAGEAALLASASTSTGCDRNADPSLGRAWTGPSEPITSAVLLEPSS